MHTWVYKIKFILTKKDIIRMNLEFDISNVTHESSLDFALSYAKKSINIS